MSPRRARGRALALLSLFALAAVSAVPRPAWAAARRTPAEVARAAADLARARCNHELHEGADEFGACIDELWAKAPTAELFCASEPAPRGRAKAAKEGKARKADCARLGLSFAGWVGGILAERMNLARADQVIARERTRFRESQRRLRLPDAALCALVPDGCAGLLTLLAEQEQAARAR